MRITLGAKARCTQWFRSFRNPVQDCPIIESTVCMECDNATYLSDIGLSMTAETLQEDTVKGAAHVADRAAHEVLLCKGHQVLQHQRDDLLRNICPFLPLVPHCRA